MRTVWTFKSISGIVLAALAACTQQHNWTPETLETQQAADLVIDHVAAKHGRVAGNKARQWLAARGREECFSANGLVARQRSARVVIDGRSMLVVGNG